MRDGIKLPWVDNLIVYHINAIENKQPKDTCYNDITVCTHSVLTNLGGLVVGQLGGPLQSFKEANIVFTFLSHDVFHPNT